MKYSTLGRIASLCVVALSGCAFLGIGQSSEETPTKTYSPQEQQLRDDYKLAKDSGERGLSGCLWDYGLLLEALDKGPEKHDSRLNPPGPRNCEAAAQAGTKHPQLLEKYTAKFAELEPQRQELLSGSQSHAARSKLDQCVATAKGFEDKQAGVSTAAVLTICREQLEGVPEAVREEVEASSERAALEEMLTKHEALLASFERLKADARYERLMDDYDRMSTEKATLEVKLTELGQLGSGSDVQSAKQKVDARIFRIEGDMQDNLSDREPLYAEHGVVLE